jgi:glycolate oxidase FAD binding subunit
MATRPQWLASLETLVGAHRCETHEAPLRELAVDGLIPSTVLWPETVEQVAAVLQWAQRERLAVVPCGSGTKIGLGAIPKRLDIVLSTRRLTQVSEYDVANFTLTAGAGMTFAQLTQSTAAHMQMLPLQYSFSTATLGGLIAANAYTPKRLRYGGVRDLLLGLRVALPSGEIAHFGGKVVKNVAGYDMCKLFLGSLGALGIIVEATFKLSALPERDETSLAVFPSLETGAAAVTQLMATPLLPSQILLLNSIATQAVAPQFATPAVAAAALLLVNCEGMDEAVERQLTDLKHICQGHGASDVEVLAGDAQLQLRARLQAAMYPREVSTSSPAALPSARGPEGAGGGALTIRLGTLPSGVHAIMAAAAQGLKPLTSGALIIGDCGVGLVRLCVGLEGIATTAIAAPLAAVLRELSGLLIGYGGHVVVENAPPELKRQIEVWGPAPAGSALLKALKRKFDPEGVLSPGRFIGGL